MKPLLRLKHSSTSSNLIVLSTSVFGSYLAVGFTMNESIQLLGATAWLALIGGVVWVSFTSSRLSIGEFLGAGLAIGTTIVAVGNLATIRLAPWLVMLLLSVLAVASATIKRTRQSLRTIEPLEDLDVAILGAIPLVALLPFNLKPLPTVLVIFGILSSRQIRTRLIRTRPSLLAMLSVVPGSMTYLLYQLLGSSPSWQDAIELDVVYDESLAHGITATGLSSSPTLLDAPVSGHFVSHATLGLLSSITKLAPFALTGLGGYFLGVVGVSLLTYSLVQRVPQRRHVAWVALSVIFAQATITVPVFFVPALRAVNAIAMLWLLFAILCHRRFLDSTLSGGFLWIAISAPLALLGKFHWGFVFLAFVAAIPLFSLLAHGTVRRPMMAAIVASVSSGAAYLIFLQSPDGEPILFGYRRDMVISAIAIVLVRFLLTGAAGRKSDIDSRAAGLTAVFVVVLWAAIGGVYRTDFLFSAVAILAAVTIVPGLLHSLSVGNLISHGIRGILVLGFVAGSGLALVRLIVTGEWRYDADIPLGPFVRPWLPDALLVGAFVGLAALWFVFFRNRSQMIPSAFTFFLAITMSLGAFCVQVTKPVVHGILFDAREFPSSIISDDQINAASWIKQNTNQKEMIATSSLCPTSLAVGETVPDNDPDNRCNGRNQNAWISAIGQRQMLIESPAYGPLAYSRVADTRHVRWYASSVEFGKNRDNTARQTLVADGVRWFVVDLELSELTDWSSQSDVVYLNDSYAIVDLLASK